MTDGADRSLLLALVTLLGIGLVQVYSSSYIFATEVHQNGLHFVLKQSLAIGIGVVLLMGAARLSWAWWTKIFPFLWGLSLVLLALTFVPGFGMKIGGARRWLAVGVLRFEPSELVKVLLPWAFSYLYRHWNEAQHWSKKIYAWPLWLGPLVLLLLQPDFGTFALLVFVILLLCFSAGFSIKYFAWAMVGLIPLFAILIAQFPYRVARVIAFLNPWADPSDTGFQLIQSLLSLRNGGFWGQGIGAGQGKLFFLPEAHTDFTLAVFAEEAGFFGVSLLFLLYGFIFVTCLKISFRVANIEARLMGLGITFLFGLNSLFNMAVSVGVLPTKGLTLPFLSYGGSSMICYCLAFGWILNLGREKSMV